MKQQSRNASCFSRRRDGVTVVTMLFFMIIMVVMMAFAVEIGRMFLLRSQVVNAVDAGTLAATMQLVEDPGDLDAAAAAANEFVQLNKVGMGVTIPDDLITVELGEWDSDSGTFTVDNFDPNAVRVNGRQQNEPFFLARLMGQETFEAGFRGIASASSNLADIMLVLDLSNSMNSNGRIEALRNAAPSFIDIIEDSSGDYQVGVMTYGARISTFNSSHSHGTLYTQSPPNQRPSGSDYVAVLEDGLTDDLDSIRNGTLSSNYLVGGKYDDYTPIGAAIRDAAHYLDNSGDGRDDADKIIVLMSDGYANRPEDNGPGYAESMATYAASLDVKIYTICLGDSVDTATMAAIAEEADGDFFDASGTGEATLTQQLTDAFEDVAGQIIQPQLVK